MSSNNYHFITKWKVKATPQEVCDILEDAAALAAWWPSVYLDVKVLDPGDVQGVGKIVELYTKGWLPYTLRWKFKVTASDAPYGYAIEALGDFVGKGVWTFIPEKEETVVVYDWKISAEKGVLKTFSFLLKPIFSWNHLWAMRKGEESLKLELLRKRSKDETELAKISAAPSPIFPHNLTNNKIL